MLSAINVELTVLGPPASGLHGGSLRIVTGLTMLTCERGMCGLTMLTTEHLSQTAIWFSALRSLKRHRAYLFRAACLCDRPL